MGIGNNDQLQSVYEAFGDCVAGRSLAKVFRACDTWADIDGPDSFIYPNFLV